MAPAASSRWPLPEYRSAPPRASQRPGLDWGSRDLREPGVTDLEALQSQTGLRHRHTAEPRLCIAERGECHVDLAGGGDVTGIERRQHLSQLAGGDMPPYADEPDSSHRQPRQVERVIARVIRQSRLGDDQPA